jgi:DNA-binding NarL/FixJ family response regulator
MMEARRKIRVLCADDNEDMLVLHTLLVDSEADMVSVGAVKDCDDVAGEVSRQRPDVLVIDFRMNGKNSLPVVREVTKSSPGTRTLVVSGFTEDEVIQACREAGACGYVPKSSDPAHLIEAIRRAAAD